jgi:flagellar basal-body rod protein FlgB
MIDGLTNAGALPVLERVMQFAGQRHRLITNTIANLDTPGFRPADVSVGAFQQHLGEAIDERRSRFGNAAGELRLSSSSDVEVAPGGLTLKPQPIGDNILFHDGNDRDLERTMQDLVENFATYRFAAQMMKNQYDLINTAIRERI